MENLPPAETLEHVNDLLLANSQTGLFVTTFYGILSIEDGGLDYTIAGHNPPILIRDDLNDVIEFKRGGTALGALPDISLSNNKISLKRGDCLVLYTDGVTEAFNTHNDMYGQARFLKLLHNLVEKSASQVIEAVEADLTNFRQGAPLSDDTTLLAIYRQPLQANQHGDGGAS
jgi:sigma-B regulation protein RsbU (phosphoserine phosphatase)